MIKRLILFCFVLFISALQAIAAGDLVVIYGEKSNEDEGERRFSKSLANHVVRWYKEGGLAADISSDVDLKTSLKGRRIACLVYLSSPTATQIKEIKTFVNGGGKLIVTYSYSQPLAELIGVRVGGYKQTISHRQMVFIGNRPQNIPAKILQSSSNIIEAFPIDGKSRVLAYWADKNGKQSTDAAWIEGNSGYWMTHVLLADGDAKAKGNLLVALSGQLIPSIWKTAAKNRINATEKSPLWTTIESALTTKDIPPKKHKIARIYLDKAIELKNNAKKLLSDNHSPDAWTLTENCELFLQKAYGVIQTKNTGEIKAVWDHSALGLYPGDWNKTCKILSDAGITDIFVNVATSTSADCNIKGLRKSLSYTLYGDQLAAAIKAAHKYGLRVHAWVLCLSTTGATKDELTTFSRNGWLVGATTGGTSNWLDPSSTGVRNHVVSICRELMKNYKIDGLHLDFIRYQDYYNSLGYSTKTRFSRDEKNGAEIKDWPKKAKNGTLFKEVSKWRVKQVTTLVAEIRTTARKMGASAIFSAAVLGKYPTCVDSVGQDWMAWLDSGYIDYAVPMNYTGSEKMYKDYLNLQFVKKNYANKIIGGIGVTASESRLSSNDVIDQINALRERNAAGFALFDLDKTLENDILPILRLGLTLP